VRYGASIGAGAIVLPDVTIGRFALVGAGAVVTRSVPDHALMVGAPARAIGWVCRCGRPLALRAGGWYCAHCDWRLDPSTALGMV
jgi:UDP-2-acetamido-3-amino-2,3-dideoxy-glucuronate N-acetyltransferase